MIINKKIKNATPKEYDGIKFKSAVEVVIYKTLLQQGFKPSYEPTKYSIWRGFKPTIPAYKPDKNGNLKIQNNKIIDITYTPDFLFLGPDNKTVIIMEVKGFQNDTYPIKEKMFRWYLEDLFHKYKQPTMFFQVKNRKQVLEAISLINLNCKKNETSTNPNDY